MNPSARRLAEDTVRAESILEDGMSAFVENWYHMPLFASLSSPSKIYRHQRISEINRPDWMAK